MPGRRASPPILLRRSSSCRRHKSCWGFGPGREYRAVEIDDSHSCPSTNAGAIARLVPTILPTMTLEPERARLVRHREPFGQPAALVELDVDHSNRPTRPGKSAKLSALSSAAIGIGERKSLQIRFAAALQRLFEQRHLCGEQACRSATRASRCRSLDWHRRPSIRQAAPHAPPAPAPCPDPDRRSTSVSARGPGHICARPPPSRPDRRRRA